MEKRQVKNPQSDRSRKKGNKEKNREYCLSEGRVVVVMRMEKERRGQGKAGYEAALMSQDEGHDMAGKDKDQSRLGRLWH
jgi:hypothetical protein